MHTCSSYFKWCPCKELQCNMNNSSFVCGGFEDECDFSPMTFALFAQQEWHLAQLIQNLHRPYLSCLLCVIALYLGELFITLHVTPGVTKGDRAAAHSPAHMWAETHRWWACARERREKKTDENNGGKRGVKPCVCYLCTDSPFHVAVDKQPLNFQ